MAHRRLFLGKSLERSQGWTFADCLIAVCRWFFCSTKEMYFVRPLPEGTRIKHARLGFGRILESDDERTLVSFEVHGFMRFNTHFLEALVIEVAGAPPRPRT